MLSFLQPKRNRRALALLLAAVLVLSPLSSMAGTYDIEDGDITVTATLEGEQNVQKVNGTQDDETIVITGSTGGDYSNTVTLNAGAGATVEVTIKDLHIQIIEEDRRAAVTTTGEGSVVIELDGKNTLTAGENHAGLQKENGGTLTIQDESGTAGTLTATGGESGAGIGGAYDWISDDPHPDASNIIITGGTIVATGGSWAAGIGGGCRGSGTDITINGGTVTANGGGSGAGIGGGVDGIGSDITITGGTVKGTGGIWAAGIGGGDGGDGTDININGGTVVATGGSHGAGIGAGGGTDKVGSDITISGGTVVAVSPEVGAGIGSGSAGTAGDITVSGDAQVSVAGGEAYIRNDFTRGPGAGIGDGGEQNHDPAADPIPGQEAAPDTDGLTTGHIYYYETGTTADEIRDQENPAKPEKVVCGSQGHVAGVPQKENEIAGSCTTDGGYDMVTYCKYCNTVMSSEHTNTGIAHTSGEPQKENETAGDCVTDGGYDLVTYCTACGNELSRQHTNTGKVHSPGEPQKENEIAGNCITDHEYDMVTYCTACGDELTRQHVNAGKVADAHDWVTDEAVPATCTETGLTEGKHCSVCHAVLVAQQEVPAKGHTEAVDPAVPATCTETGLTAGKHCSVCNAVLVAQQEVPAKGHTEAVDPAVPATCTETGLTEGKHCSVCHAVLVAQEVVPALDHDWIKDEAVAPTCTETGLTEGKHCSRCTEKVAQEVVPALDHDWVVDKAVAPTCTKTGLTEGKHCSRCTEKVAQEVVPAMDHDWIVDKAVAPTCTKTGLTEGKHCSRCDAVAEQIELPAPGHAPGEAVKENEVPVTATQDGSYDLVVYCTVCHEELSREKKVIPKPSPTPTPTPTPAPTPTPTPAPTPRDDEFTRFCLRLAERIRMAPENGVVEADAGAYTGLMREVFEALHDRPDVTLKIACQLDGQRTELTIPAGRDVLNEMGGARILTFAEIAKIIGE